MLRTCALKIKEVYDPTKKGDAARFVTRFASIASKDLFSEKKVIAVEPNYLYVVVSALHGDAPNQNGDFFKWTELLKKKTTGAFDGKYTFETWIGKPVCENHNINAKRGTIIDVWPINEEKSIDMLHRIDEKINPNLVKGIRNGSVKGTSMGVMVGHSYCSVCKNLAYDESQWCNHLSPSKLNLKGRRYSGQDGNLYPDKIGSFVYEDNRNLEGCEDSYITLGEPADEKALAKQVLAVKNLKLSN